MSEEIKSDITGYGLVFKSILKRNDIDIEAKSLYAYLSSYAGSDTKAFPGVSLICHDLNISEKRFQKYRKQLEVAGVITIERKRTANGFSKNVYTINHKSSGHSVPVENLPERNLPERNLPNKNNSSKNNSSKNNSGKRDDIQISIDYINHNLEMITSPMKIQEIEYLVNDIKNQKLEIVKVATNYCKENRKGVNYLIKVLTNWINENIDTKEKAEDKIKPKTKKAKSDNFGDLRQKILGGASDD